jgi:hypothetical protein
MVMVKQTDILPIVETGLKKIELPPLTRPDVADDNPNEDLVLWSIQFYAYSVIAHLRTVLRGLVQLIDGANIPTAFVVCRHVFEWAAHTCYMCRNTKNYVERKEWRRAWHLHSLAMQGNRWAKEYGTKYEPAAITNDIPDPLTVANIVSCYEKYQRQLYGHLDARDSYSLLSEHSHPNSACFLPYYEYIGREVRFIAPPADASLLGEERCLIDLMMSLAELLALGRENVVSAQVIAIVKELADSADQW